MTKIEPEFHQHGGTIPVAVTRQIGSRRAALKQIDVKRSLAGVRAAGLNPEEIIITTTGDIRIRLAGVEAKKDETENEIERHFAGRWS